MSPDPICPICDHAVASGIPVVFDHGLIAHLDCYIATEGAATLIRSFLASRPGERFCYTCLARHLTGNRQEIEKAATGLRLTRSVVVEPGLCSTCTYARVTIRLKQAAGTQKRKQISLDEFEHIVVASGCRTISVNRRYRPKANARAVTYACTLRDFLRASAYLCRFLDRSERRVVPYDSPDARPILLHDFVLRRDLTEEMLTRWQRLGRDVSAVSSAELLVFTCSGCRRSLIVDGNHRIVCLATSRRYDAIVSVSELKGSQWPADMPDMSVICCCPIP